MLEDVAASAAVFRCSGHSVSQVDQGELSFLYLFDAYDSFLNIIRNLEAWREQKEIEALCPPLISSLSNALSFSTG